MSLGPETSVALTGGGELRAPAHPKECTYVRVVGSDFREVAYWDCAEWEEDPVGVMGAIIGAMKSAT